MLNKNAMGGYDRSLTMFSPDGRLFQVEYALEAVRRGSLAVGLKGKNGAVLVIQKKTNSPLMDRDSLQKIFKVDHHIGCAISGLHADSRILVDYARVQCQVYKLSYNEPITVVSLVRRLADIKQQFTQHGGSRPFGSALLFIGYDKNGPQVMTTSPTGRYWSWKATCLGAGEETARNVLEENYNENDTLEDLMKLGVRAHIRSSEEEITPEIIEIAYIDAGEEKPTFKWADKKITEKIVKDALASEK